MPEVASTLAFGPFVLDPTRRKLRRGGEEIALSPKAFDVLTLLAANGGRVVTKETMLRTVWPDTVVDEANLAFQISTLRKALGEGERFIVTIPGRGYQLAASVQSAEASEMLVEERTSTTITADVRRPILIGLAALLLVAITAIVLLRRPRPSVAPRIESLAVLPFKPIVPAQRDEALEIGMADTLIARISRLREIVVRPLTSVRRFSGVEQDPIEAGRQLGVDAVLDGSIQTANGRIRVNARLLRVSDGRQLWQDEFEDRAGDLFAIQDSVSTRVVDALALNLSPQQQQDVRRRGTENIEAYRAYAVARMHFLRVRPARYEKSAEYLKRAISFDPNYAEAWAALGDIYARSAIGADKEPRESFPLALETTQKAIALDPQLVRPWVNLAVIDFWHNWDWKSAEDKFRRAIELDPNLGDAHILYAHLLSNTGRHEESRREASIALRLEPINALINNLAGQFLMQAGDYDGAIRQLEHTLALDRDVWLIHLNLGKTYELQGRYDEALAAIEKARSGSDTNVEPLVYIAHIHAAQGRRREALDTISQLLEISRQRYVPGTKLALPHAALGNRDEAFRWLRKACADRDVSLTFLNVNPRWNVLRSDPRFGEIERCVGLPATH